MNIHDDISKKSDFYRQEIAEALKQASDDPSEPAGFNTANSFMYGDMPPKRKAGEYLEAAVGWVYACVSAISDAIAKIDFELYQIKNKEIVEVPEHAVLDLLYRVNKHTTKFDHLSLSQQYLELTGEAPWFIDRGKSGMGEPQNILLLRPDRLDIKKAGAGLANPIAGYVYRTDLSNKIEIGAEEMILLKYPDPVNLFRGKGTLQAAASTVDIDTFSEDFNRRFFYNSARPDSILTTDQKLTPRQRELLKQDIKRLYQGRENSHKTAILESGLDWKPMSLSQKDMDFLEQQKFSMTKILSIFRVPKSIIAISDDVNLANAKIGEYVFAKWTVVPKLERITAQLNEFLLPMFGGTENMFLDYKSPVPSDVDSDVKRYDSALGKGYMTINEVRAELGLDDIGEEGDVIYLPTSVVPIDQAGMAPFTINPNKGILNKKKKAADIIRRSAGGYQMATRRLGVAKKVADAKKESQRKIDELENKINEITASMIKKIIQSKTKKPGQVLIAKEDVDPKFKIFAGEFLKSADRFEADFYKTMIEQFERQKKTILRRAPKKAAGDVDKFLLDEEEETGIMVRIYTPMIKDLIRESGTRAGKLISEAEAFDMGTRIIRQYIKNRTLRFSFEVTEETNNLLKITLNEGIKLGEGIPDLRKRVSELFDGMEKYRAEKIARSEVIRGSNFAAQEAYRQSKVVEQVEWLATDDDRICEFCAPMNGEVIDLGDTFFDKGDSYRGSDGGLIDLNYEDIEHPPLHVNCVAADTIINAPLAKAITQADYSGELIEISAANGRRLSVTPNHAILTARGFVAAKLLCKGDQIIDCSGFQGIIGSNPDVDQGPATISQIFETLQKDFGMTAMSMPVAAENFHGDGISCQGNIDIISTDSLLAGGRKSSLPQHINQSLFCGADAKLSDFSGSGNLFAMLVALASAADGIVGGDGIASILNDSAIANHKAISLGLTANYDARFKKAAIDKTSADIQALREAIDRFAGQIAFFEITDIKRNKFGHIKVYDVSDISTVYIANGILSSNCRCALIPVIK